ncbi:MAG: N-acetyltransferase [Candidatus Omnitrophota bacterium]
MNTVDHLMEFYSMAQKTNVFREQELKILKELLESSENPLTGYILFKEKVFSKASGFAIIGKTPCTTNTWDIYWLVVSPECQGKGIAQNLIKQIESYLLAALEFAVLRVETSSTDAYCKARAFYVKQGFVLSGTIKDFYMENDDLLTYSKKIKITESIPENQKQSLPICSQLT